MQTLEIQNAAGAGRRQRAGSTTESTAAVPPVAARRWPWLVRGFYRYLNRYLRRHLHTIRISRAGPAPALRGRPTVICMNHPSWWDPLICAYLAGRLYPQYEGYGPIDAAVIGKYRFFERIGIFPVEQATARGARAFLRTCEQLLSDPQRMLWITAEGGFTDPRLRPVTLRPGVGHLAARNRGIQFLPLAVELAFWQERTPEVLLRFGSPVVVYDPQDRDRAAWTAHLAASLEAAMDALARESMRRHAADFELLLGGRAGVGGFYDLWRRCKAIATGQPFTPAHGSR